MPHSDGERQTILVVVGAVGVFALAGIGSVAWLSFNHSAVPEGLLTLTGTALGALCSMLVRTSSSGPGGTPVTVTNTPSDPVNTTTLDDPSDDEPYTESVPDHVGLDPEPDGEAIDPAP